MRTDIRLKDHACAGETMFYVFCRGDGGNCKGLGWREVVFGRFSPESLLNIGQKTA